MENTKASTPSPVSSTTAQLPTRGRGRGSFYRGRGRGYSTANKDKAASQINPSGSKVMIDQEFLGSRSLERGNIKVFYDHGFTERTVSVYHDNISALQSGQNFFDNEGKPYELDYLTRGLGGGLCLSSAVKLIQSTPASDLPLLGSFKAFEKFQVQVPKTFVPILDLLGKTDISDGNFVIRVGDNATMIGRLLLKSIRYFMDNQDFSDNYIFFDEEKLAKFKTLGDISLKDFGNIYFTDQSSVNEIKRRAEEVVRSRINKNFEVTLDDGTKIQVSYPQLPTTYSKGDILHWLGMFNTQKHKDWEPIVRAGILLLVDLRWLTNASKNLEDIDSRFKDTIIAKTSPLQMLKSCNLHHFSEFLELQDLLNLARSCYTYYDSVITLRLIPLLSLTMQGHSVFGNSGQIITMPEDQFYDADDRNLPRREFNTALNHSLSFIKHISGDKVMLASMIGLTRDVWFDADYQNHFASSLYHSRFAYLSRDGLMNAKEKQFK